VNGKEAAYFGVPWEDAYGYAQAIKVGDTIHVSGQLSHDENGNLIAPASLDESGKPAEFSMMEQQMRATYANAVKLLARFGTLVRNSVVDRSRACGGAQVMRCDTGMPRWVMMLMTLQPAAASAFCVGRVRAWRRRPITVL
jgi:hypothetical protein